MQKTCLQIANIGPLIILIRHNLGLISLKIYSDLLKIMPCFKITGNILRIDDN